MDIINDNTAPSPLERGLGGEARNDIHINHVHNNNLEVAIVLAKDNNSIPPSPFMERGCPQRGRERGLIKLLIPLAGTIGGADALIE